MEPARPAHRGDGGRGDRGDAGLGLPFRGRRHASEHGVDFNLVLPRWLTVVDAAVVLALSNCAVLAWHACVLHRQAGLSGGVNSAENSR